MRQTLGREAVSWSMLFSVPGKSECLRVSPSQTGARSSADILSLAFGVRLQLEGEMSSPALQNGHR